MKKILEPAFFDRPTLLVAKDLLGKFLVRRVDGKTIALMITEVEAYDGFKDKASHASRGRTPRNAPMFAEASAVYVYFTYGMHWMLNLVCREANYPAAVLVRGAGEIVGPARLTKALAIDRSLNAKKLGRASGLWVEDRGIVIKPRGIIRTPRIGIAYAQEYVHKPWRFVLRDGAILKPYQGN